MASFFIQSILFTCILFVIINSSLLKDSAHFYHSYHQTAKLHALITKLLSSIKKKIKRDITFRNLLTIKNEPENSDKSKAFPRNQVPFTQFNSIAYPLIDEKIKKLQISKENLLSTNSIKRRGNEGSLCRRNFDGKSGYCLSAPQCLHVIKEYREHGIKIDVCTYDKNVPIICCPLTQKRFEDHSVSFRKCLKYYPIALRYLDVDGANTSAQQSCVSSVPMIVNGEVTRHGEYPHMTAVGWTQDEGEIQWDCGGTLISKLFVLTAAHCATSNVVPPDMVRLGVNDLSILGSYQQDIKISTIIIHPKYKFPSYYHDIALLKLVESVRLSEFVRPACLWQWSDTEARTVIATGWGRTGFLGPKSNKLRKVELDLIEPEVCRNLYWKDRRLPHGIIDEQICAGSLSGGKDTCQGDSGGPLYIDLPEYNCVQFVIGITSFGKFCASPKAPGVYTKIYPYLHWIEKNVFG